MTFLRFLSERINEYTNNSKSVLLFGPRQTGKSTLIENILSKAKKEKLIYKLQEVKTFQEIVKNPAILGERVELKLKENKSLILYIDEVQKIPSLMDECQYLIDTYKKAISVILTGSSARKLRRGNVNLLPGRVFREDLHSLILPEIMELNEQRIIPIKIKEKIKYKKNISLNDLLVFGSLPGVLSEEVSNRSRVLRSYVSTYLQEEIREEALSRNLGDFSNFLSLSAFESNCAPNLSNLSKEVGVKISTIRNYFEILEDTLITFSIPPFKKESRKLILSTPKYVYFDLGIRNAACGMPLNYEMLNETGGKLFEQFVILEVIKRIKYQYPSWKYFYWRTNHGLEVDLVIQTDEEIIPIEIKYTKTPQEKHIKHLKIFMEEYKKYKVKRGYLIGNFSSASKFSGNIYAIPWNEI